MLASFFRFLAGNDVFLSYHWRERNKKYANRLHEQLESRGLDCFVDDKRLSRGEIVPSGLRREIRRSKLMVVLITPEIRESTWVPEEIAIAAEYKRKIVPVNFAGSMNDGLLEDGRWAPLRNRSRIEETEEALQKGEPSPHVAREIDDAFEFTRQRVIALRIIFAAGVVFFGMSIAAVTSAVGAVKLRKDSEAKITALQYQASDLASQIKRSKEERARLKRQTEEARAARDQADRERDQAAIESKKQKNQAFDQLLFKGYAAASAAGDRTAAFAIVRRFLLDDQTSGWRDAAVSVLQDPLPAWQSGEDLFSVDPGGRRLVLLTADRRLVVRELDRPEKAIVLGGQDWVMQEGMNFDMKKILWSPDGNYVGVCPERRLAIWNLQRPGKPVLQFEQGFGAAFSPETNLVAVEVHDGETLNGLEFWRLADPPVKEAIQPLNGIVWGKHWVKGRESWLCDVSAVGKRKDSGLWEIGPKINTRLTGGAFAQDYWITEKQELVTKTRNSGRPVTTTYRVQPLPWSTASSFDMTLTGVDPLSFSALTVGGGNRFVLVIAEQSIWMGDRQHPKDAPVRISVTPSGAPGSGDILRALPDNRLAVATDQGKKFTLFDLAHLDSGRPFEGTLADLSPNGTWVRTAKGFQNLEKGWTYSIPGSNPLDRSEIDSAKYSSDSRFAAAHIKGTSQVVLVDLVHFSRPEPFDHPAEEGPSVLLLDPPGGKWITATADLTRIWKRAPRREWTVGEDSLQFALAASPDGETVWLEEGGFGHWRVQSWMHSGNARYSLPFTAKVDAIGVDDRQTGLVVTTEDLSDPDRDERTTFHYWTLDGSAAPKPQKSPARMAEFAAVSRDTLRVLTIQKSGEAAVWNAPFDKPAAQIPVEGGTHRGALSNKGTAAAFIKKSGWTTDALEAWSLADLDHPRKLRDYVVRHFGDKTFDLAISDDGRQVVAFGMGPSTIFSGRFPQGKVLSGVENGSRRLEFSPSGTRVLATLFGGGAAIWSVDRPDHPELVMRFPSVMALARFGKTDDTVITVTMNREMRVWDISAAGLRAELNRLPALCLTPAEARAYLGEASQISPGLVCREPRAGEEHDRTNQKRRTNL